MGHASSRGIFYLLQQVTLARRWLTASTNKQQRSLLKLFVCAEEKMAGLHSVVIFCYERRLERLGIVQQQNFFLCVP